MATSVSHVLYCASSVLTSQVLGGEDESIIPPQLGGYGVLQVMTLLEAS